MSILAVENVLAVCVLDREERRERALVAILTDTMDALYNTLSLSSQGSLLR